MIAGDKTVQASTRKLEISIPVHKLTLGRTTAPVAADLANDECIPWLEVAGSKVMVAAKIGDVLRTGEVVLA